MKFFLWQIWNLIFPCEEEETTFVEETPKIKTVTPSSLNKVSMKFVLIRSQEIPYKETLGNLLLVNEESNIVFMCKTLELAWKDNKRSISCIPTGTYPIRLSLSPKYGMAWELYDVPNRSEIKIHNGNYSRQIEGCILVGRAHAQVDNDGLMDVQSSMPTRLKMEKVLADANINETTITIIDIT